MCLLAPEVLVAAVLQAVERLMQPAVSGTLEALELAPEDAAAAKLAETYASALDQARAVEAQADRVLRRAKGEEPELVEEVRALRAKLSAQVTLSQVGPKLLDVLTALGASPKARASLPKGGPARGGALAAVRSARGA